MIDAELVGDLIDHPEPVPVLDGPERIAAGSRPGFRVAGGGTVVADLAIERRTVAAQAQPSVPGAVAHRISGQLMCGGHDVVDPRRAQPGRGSDRCSMCMLLRSSCLCPGRERELNKRLGSNVKVNQNCLNITDPDLQGRAQANNETFVAEDALHPEHLVASDNNYIRGDGTCGAHFSLDGGRRLVRIPPSPTVSLAGYGDNARQYWQAGGDTLVAWDTRGDAYLSCQLFNRGTVASANPDLSSGFVIFARRATMARPGTFPAAT